MLIRERVAWEILLPLPIDRVMAAEAFEATTVKLVRRMQRNKTAIEIRVAGESSRGERSSLNQPPGWRGRAECDGLDWESAHRWPEKESGPLSCSWDSGGLCCQVEWRKSFRVNSSWFNFSLPPARCSVLYEIPLSPLHLFRPHIFFLTRQYRPGSYSFVNV